MANKRQLRQISRNIASMILWNYEFIGDKNTNLTDDEILEINKMVRELSNILVKKTTRVIEYETNKIIDAVLNAT